MAAAGLLDPTLAAFIHVACEMAFLLNAARLLPRAERESGATDLSGEPENKPVAGTAEIFTGD